MENVHSEFLLCLLIDRYLKGLLDPCVTLLEVYKLMYFMQEAQQPLRFNYVKGLTARMQKTLGMYSKPLRDIWYQVMPIVVTIRLNSSSLCPVRHGPVSIYCFYGTPTQGNIKAEENYAANSFSVTRQLRYSRVETQLALDMAIFINGLVAFDFHGSLNLP